MLSKDAINEFKAIYFRKYGISLSEQEAMEHANQLIGLYKSVVPVGSSRKETNNTVIVNKESSDE